VFVASFVLPEKKQKMHDEDRRIGEEQIRELVDEQMKDVKARISDVVDETVTYSVEKTERSLERLTNEKIMAVNEYSDTVLQEIHKNHEEVVFLYDMLNDKHENLKSTAASVEKTAKETLQKVQAAETVAQNAEVQAAEVQNTGVQTGEAPIQTETEQRIFTAGIVTADVLETELLQQEITAEPKKKTEKAKTTRKSTAKKAKEKQAADVVKKPEEIPEMNLNFVGAGEEGANNNEKILALHKEGKSNVAIARELGLGIGEVKLVIDLFKGV